MPTTAAIEVDTTPAIPHSDGFSEQLKRIHKRIQRQYPFVSGIEIATHHSPSRSLNLFSTLGKNHITQFIKLPFQKQARDQVIRLEAQVIDDLSPMAPGEKEIDRPITVSEFQSGLTVPFVINEQLQGFAFFTAAQKHCFTSEIIKQMHVYTRVITQLISGEQGAAQCLHSAVSAILRLNHVSQSESPAHLKRVGHYSRLIAQGCKDRFSLDAQWIEHLYLFAPLHDIGKVFMPEGLLNKPGRFTEAEFALMKTHTLKGRELIDHMIESFGYNDDIHYADMLRNIITYHHETIDGGGYPAGLKGREIPLEARIVAVADVLDALMTKRAYKEAWSVDKSIAKLRSLAGSKLEPGFVEILASNKERLVEIRSACAT